MVWYGINEDALKPLKSLRKRYIPHLAIPIRKTGKHLQTKQKQKIQKMLLGKQDPLKPLKRLRKRYISLLDGMVWHGMVWYGMV